MNFKQFYTLKESPDRSFFFHGDKTTVLSYKTYSICFITFQGCCFYKPNFYHGDLLRIIRDYCYNVIDETGLTKQNVTMQGKLSHQDKLAFIDKYKKKQTDFSRTLFLNFFPKSIVGRMWFPEMHDVSAVISTWNNSSVVKNNLPDLQLMLNQLNLTHDDSIYLEVAPEKYKTMMQFKKLEQDSNEKTYKSVKQLEQLHTMPSAAKKQQLIKIGAKPKTPVNLADKMRVSAEQKTY